jgi:hypothetical protein
MGGSDNQGRYVLNELVLNFTDIYKGHLDREELQVVVVVVVVVF